MKARGKFKFKEITKKSGGEFKNSKGDIIKYNESYLLKLDEKTDKGIMERTFKLSFDNPIVSQLLNYEEYTDIILDFDVLIYPNLIRIVPVGIVSK